MCLKDDMINAILRGEKTQFRKRITEIKHPESEIKDINGQLCGLRQKIGWLPILDCCYFKVDDILWIREPWSFPADEEIAKGVSPTKILYRANGPNQPIKQKRWKPPVLMPRNFARVYLYVTNVRLQRLQNITDDECDKDGVNTEEYQRHVEQCNICGIEPMPKRLYWGYYLWDNTLCKRQRHHGYDDIYFDNCWDTNPLVWVIEFKLCNIVGEPLETPITIY